MIRRPPRSTLDRSSAASDVYKRQIFTMQWFFEDGATAFVRAAQSSDTELMKVLLEYHADPFLATANGDTALTAAGGIGWVEGVTYERSPQENVDCLLYTSPSP